MNQLETNLTLWAICSILLFEILIIIFLCRCCFNRIKPKKFYVKRDEYEYLQDINGATHSKYQSTVLRPPHADQLAHIGTIRVQNGLQNFGYYRDDQDGRISPEQIPSSQQWFELQPPMINTAQLPAADYEVYPYPTDDYSYRQPPPRPIFIDFRPYRDEGEEIENYRLESLRRPDIILPQVQRLDTSTEYYGIQYANAVPKSILKSGINPTPPIDFPITPYLQIDRSQSNDESLRTSVKTNTDQSILIDHPTNVMKKTIPIQPILSPTIPTTSKYRMKFAYIGQLHDVEWEVPGEFRTIFQTNDERTPPLTSDSNTPISWQRETNSSQSHYSWKGDITQQKAFEY